MKPYKSILIILSCIAFLISCDKENNEDLDFYNTEYRLGLWVTHDKKDTLNFVNSSTMIRKGFYYENEEYSYKIENNTLFTLPGTDYQGQHPILHAKKDKVILGNMYFTTWMSDNSGVFIKQNKQ